MSTKSYSEILPWDTEFFKFPVARINDDINIFNKEVFESLSENNTRLAYYSSPQKISIPQHTLYEIKLVDEKITYTKKIINHPSDAKISSYVRDYPEQKLIDLAIESGFYSRFNNDKKIGSTNFINLYTQWIVKSVSRDIADDVLVYHEGNILAGFVTVGHKSNKATIGIIAVDKNYRGKGISKALMLTAENIYTDTCESIQVITQRANVPACNLYESCGYHVENTEYFYHFWKND